ncbi:MBL fold metallo-hydrolase [Jeotgalibacillus soli]|uniref:Beta-lactamase n=1 Tax=Jeotgalibacillus soli TaxID=889306 RepID=A0A0C2V5L0_9BACL|nr:MBL fold metallo-hydrolase [Jeotgalibacillus soli]KIL44282.1 beta-lactamase [Jeotgalibacillus soli]
MIQWHNGIAQLTIPTPFAVGDVHIYLIKGERLTLVDTGPKTEEAWRSLLDQLNELELTPTDIEQIVLTHHHPDHAGLIECFDQATVWGAKETNRWLTRESSFMQDHDQFYRSLFQQVGLPSSYFILIDKMKVPLSMLGLRGLDGVLADQDGLPGEKGWTVIETPGHAQGHISLLRESDGILIGGDVLLDKVSSNPLVEPPHAEGEARPLSQLQYNASLERLLTLPITTVLPGHGPLVTDSHGLIQERLKKQHDRAMHVKELLAEKEMTAFDLCVLLFPAVYKEQLGLTLSETVAQLDYLLERKEIEEIKQTDGSIVYRALHITKGHVYE